MNNSDAYEIRTKYFGDMSINKNDIITFHKGLLGLEDYKQYTLFDMPDNDKIVCLQSIKDQHVAFLLIKPWDFFPSYDVDISDDELGKIKCTEIAEIVVFNILTLAEDISKTTANLLAPIIINIVNKEGMQLIVNENQYTTKHLVFNQEGEQNVST